MRNLFPREALPDGETNRDGRIEVTTRGRGTCDDSESDTNSKAPANLKDIAEGCRIGFSCINVEGSDGCYAGEAASPSVSRPGGNTQKHHLHIEEDSCSFCHALPQPTWPNVMSI